MILKETSLMPPIPGLLALLSMLFAPAIELRYSCVFKSGIFFLGPSQIGDRFFSPRPGFQHLVCFLPVHVILVSFIHFSIISS